MDVEVGDAAAIEAHVAAALNGGGGDGVEALLESAFDRPKLGASGIREFVEAADVGAGDDEVVGSGARVGKRVPGDEPMVAAELDWIGLILLDVLFTEEADAFAF